jgi:hypothetical protein
MGRRAAVAKGSLPPAFLRRAKVKAKGKAPREGSAAEERMDRAQGVVPGKAKPNPFAKAKPFSKGGKA